MSPLEKKRKTIFAEIWHDAMAKDRDDIFPVPFSPKRGDIFPVS
jgi:hypothetical protein